MRGCLIMPLIGFVFLISFAPTIVLAQKAEETKYSWGRVTSASSEQIVISEYDYDRDEDVEVTYSVSPEIEIRGVSSLKEIKIGDDIEIEYLTQGDKRTIKVIAVEKVSEAGEQGREFPINEP